MATSAEEKSTLVVKPPKFTELNDLTCDQIGGTVVFATDDWFASK
jgi:allantoicase